MLILGVALEIIGLIMIAGTGRPEAWPPAEQAEKLLTDIGGLAMVMLGMLLVF